MVLDYGNSIDQDEEIWRLEDEAEGFIRELNGLGIEEAARISELAQRIHDDKTR
jgi:hypothetical protein